MKNKSSLPTHVPKHMVGMFLVFGAAVVLAVLVTGCWMWRSEVPQRLNRLPNPATLPPMPEAPAAPQYPASSTQGSKDQDPYYTDKNMYGYTGYEFDRLDYAARKSLLQADFLKLTPVEVAWQAPVKVATSTSEGVFSADQEASFPLGKGPYLRGVVKTGQFKGSKVYSYTQFEGEMGGPWEVVYMYLQSSDGLVTGVDVWGEGYGLYGHINESSERLDLPDLPEVLVLGNGKKLMFSHSIWTADCWTTGCSDYKKMTITKEGLTVFQRDPSHSSMYYVFTKDGRAFLYTLALPGGSAMAPSEGTRVDPVYLPKVFQWNANYENQDSFVEFYRGGCGGAATSSIMTENQVKSHDLVVIGKMITGEALYGVRDYRAHPLTAVAYDYWFGYDAYGEKPDIEGFLKEHPVPYFFYRNPLGELVRYVLGDGVNVGECGKPVIYLYPPKTTNVSVKLGSNINVTVSEPTYPTQGWNVFAQPNGDLLYQGQTYGSLFWEGTGVGYEVPKTGFLIKDGQVDQQLKVILAKYGLNEKESAEFREFWVPKMTGAKYYRVSFVETAAWNKAAPLAVSPRPTSVLRIFMDWQKLSAPIQIQEPKIQPFVRDGFTLVEWGGLLRK